MKETSKTLFNQFMLQTITLYVDIKNGALVQPGQLGNCARQNMMEFFQNLAKIGIVLSPKVAFPILNVIPFTSA